MKSASAVLPLVLAGCCCWSSPPDSDLFRIDAGRLTPEDAQRVERLFRQPTVAVELEPKLVSSSKEAYQFLIEELPFTAACVRVLGKGKYVITRAEGEPNTFVVDDQSGMKLEMRRLYHDDLRWIYVGRVTYSGTSWGKIEGDALTMAAAREGPEGLMSEARIYCRLESLIGLIGRVVPGVFASALRRKGNMFTEAARVVSEEVKRDPYGFYEKMKASSQVDPGTLEKFRQRFIK